MMETLMVTTIMIKNDGEDDDVEVTRYDFVHVTI